MTETADLRRAERRRIDGVKDPHQQLTRLRKLLRTLRTDLSRHGEL